MKTVASRVAIVALGFLAAWGTLGYLATSPVVGNQPELRKRKAEPQDFGLRAERVTFTSTDGIPLVAWWLPTKGQARGTLVLAHGRDGNRSDMLPRASFLARNSYNVLALDLRAHGESGGHYMTPGYLEAQDVLGGVCYLRQRGVGGPIALLGHSYGAVAVLHAAAQSSDVSAVIADSAFISPADVLERASRFVSQDPEASIWVKIGVRLASSTLLDAAARPMFYLRTGVWLDPRRAKALSAIARLGDRPVLFIAGEHDQIAPPENTRRMYNAALSARKQLSILPGATHNTYGRASREYEATVLAFLESALARE